MARGGCDSARGGARNGAEEKGLKCEALLMRGRTDKAIIKVSDEVEADHIIVGSTGIARLKRVLVGSESEKVLHRSMRACSSYATLKRGGGIAVVIGLPYHRADASPSFPI